METHTFFEIQNFIHDASGIDAPNNYLWYRDNGIYYPVLRGI